MGGQPAGHNGALNEHDQLLLSLAQQLRQPLLHIARQAELGRLLASAGGRSLEQILISSETALTLVDNYVLSLQTLARGQDLWREPVSVGAVLFDAAAELAPAAKQYGVLLELDTSSRIEPVSMHRPSLQAAFVSLGHALIEALAGTGESTQLRLKLAAHRCRYGVVAGLYCDHDEITVHAFRRSQQLHGTARQPLNVFASSGAGIFVADALLKAMSAKLKVSRRQHQYGLAAILQPINQLQLV